MATIYSNKDVWRFFFFKFKGQIHEEKKIEHKDEKMFILTLELMMVG